MNAMDRPRVAVIGGGLAGLSAACALVSRGVGVTLLEARSRCGGATFSFSRGGMRVDNGQHVLLRCYEQYRGFVDVIGSGGSVGIQRRFTMPLIGEHGRRVSLRRTAAPAPFHLAAGLATYNVLSAVDRMRVVTGALAMRRLDPQDPELDDISFGAWRARHGQNNATIAA